jgi:hypothetical protein
VLLSTELTGFLASQEAGSRQTGPIIAKSIALGDPEHRLQITKAPRALLDMGL